MKRSNWSNKSKSSRTSARLSRRERPKREVWKSASMPKKSPSSRRPTCSSRYLFSDSSLSVANNVDSIGRYPQPSKEIDPARFPPFFMLFQLIHTHAMELSQYSFDCIIMGSGVVSAVVIRSSANTRNPTITFSSG